MTLLWMALSWQINNLNVYFIKSSQLKFRHGWEIISHIKYKCDYMPRFIYTPNHLLDFSKERQLIPQQSLLFSIPRRCNVVSVNGCHLWRCDNWSRANDRMSWDDLRSLGPLTIFIIDEYILSMTINGNTASNVRNSLSLCKVLI